MHAAELCGSQRRQGPQQRLQLEAASPTRALSHPSLPQATEKPLLLVLVGNKMDLRPGLPEAAGVHTAHGQQLAMVSRRLSGPRGPH